MMRDRSVLRTRLDLGVLGLRPPTGAEDRVIVISKEMLNEDIEINPDGHVRGEPQ